MNTAPALSNADRVLDLLDDHGVDPTALTSDLVSAYTHLIKAIGPDRLAAALNLVPSNPKPSDLGSNLLREFNETFIGTYPSRQVAALAIASFPGGLLHGVSDVEAAGVYFDHEGFLDDMSNALRGPLRVFGDGPVHVFSRTGMVRSSNADVVELHAR